MPLWVRLLIGRLCARSRPAQRRHFKNGGTAKPSQQSAPRTSPAAFGPANRGGLPRAHERLRRSDRKVCGQPRGEFDLSKERRCDGDSTILSARSTQLTTYAALTDDMVATGEGAPLEWHDRWKVFAAAIEEALEHIVRAEGSTPEAFFLSLNGMQQVGGEAGGATVARFLDMVAAA